MHTPRIDGKRTMKWKDEIVEEVRAAREAYAARFGCDLKRMFEDLKAEEAKNPARRASFEPLKPHVPHP